MAEAYGKLTGRPAAAMVTRGPGACHAAIGVHVAQQDSTPLLLFVGQIPFEETDRESFQEVDYRRMFGPLAKWVTQIDDARRIPELVAHAVDVATTGRPGPVVIALSEEMQKHTVEVPDLRARRGAAGGAGSGARSSGCRRCWRAAASRWRSSAARPGPRRGGRRSATSCVAHDMPVAVGFRRQALYDGTLANFVGDLGVGSDPALVAAREGGRPDPGDRHPARRGGRRRATRCSTRRAPRRSCTSIPIRRRSAGCSGWRWGSPAT